LHAHVQDLELGALQDDEVLVRLVATGVCHTDLDLDHINEALEDQETGRVIKPIIKF
jgi:Zn-dependent alcohol dehydrogenase